MGVIYMSGNKLIKKMMIFLLSVLSINIFSSDNFNVTIYRGNLQRTGYFNTTGVDKMPDIKWKFKVGKKEKINENDPPIIINDILYFSTRHPPYYYLYSLDAKTGKLKWKKEYNESINLLQTYYKGKLIIKDGALLQALDGKTGKKIWFSIEFPYSGASIPIVYNDIMYVGINDYEANGEGELPVSYLYAIDINNGNILWKKKLGDGVFSDLSFDDRKLYFNVQNKAIAFDINTKKIIWENDLKFPENGSPSGPPVIGDTLVYYMSDYGKLEALDKKTGAFRWKFIPEKKSYFDGTPSFYNDKLFFGIDKNYYLLDSKTGKVLKKFYNIGKWFDYSSCITNNSVISVAGGKVIAIDLKGEKILWEYEIKDEDYITTMPVVLDGVIYFGTEKGYLYALEETK